MDRIEIVAAANPGEIEQVRSLFQAYAAWLDVDLCLQDFGRELAALPGSYAPPRGRLLLARAGGEAAGCVGLRPLDHDRCEMKRLWVEPGFAGRGIGRRLAETIVAAGRALGYRAMRLDTLPDRQKAARHLYRSLGFREITDHPPEGVATFELTYRPATDPSNQSARS